MLYITVNITQCVSYVKPSLQLIAGVMGVGGIAKRLIFLGIGPCTKSRHSACTEINIKRSERDIRMQFKMYS